MFILQHYEQMTLCNHTQLIIWGIGPQGYRCQNCDFDVLKKHVYSVEEACVGPSLDKKKKKNRTSLNILNFAKSKEQPQLLDPGRKSVVSVSPSPSMRVPGDLPSSLTVGGSPSFRSFAKILGETEDQVDDSTSGAATSHDGSVATESRPLPTPPSLAQCSGSLHLQHMNLLDSAARKLGAVSGNDLNAGSRSTSSASESWGGSTASSGRQGDGGGAKVTTIKRSESANDGNKRAQPRLSHR